MGAGVSVREGALARSGVLPAHLQRTAAEIHGAEPMAFDDEIASWEHGLRKQSQTPFKDWPAHDAAVGRVRDWRPRSTAAGRAQRASFAKAASPRRPRRPAGSQAAAAAPPRTVRTVSAPPPPPRALLSPSRARARAPLTALSTLARAQPSQPMDDGSAAAVDLGSPRKRARPRGRQGRGRGAGRVRGRARRRGRAAAARAARARSRAPANAEMKDVEFADAKAPSPGAAGRARDAKTAPADARPRRRRGRAGGRRRPARREARGVAAGGAAASAARAGAGGGGGAGRGQRGQAGLGRVHATGHVDLAAIEASAEKILMGMAALLGASLLFSSRREAAGRAASRARARARARALFFSRVSRARGGRATSSATAQALDGEDAAARRVAIFCCKEPQPRLEGAPQVPQGYNTSQCVAPRAGVSSSSLRSPPPRGGLAV